MGGNGAPTVCSSASYAFMGRLDSFTSSIYPHEMVQEQDSEDAPRVNVNSRAAIYPVLVSMVRLTAHMFPPYLAIGLLVLAALGYASIYCTAVGAAILTYLCLFDERFGQMVLGHMPPLPPGLHCHRSARTDAVVSMVPALRFPYYKGTPWIMGGDMATIYPFLAFRVPAVEYTRRWLTVPSDDTKKTGGNHDFSGDEDVLDDTFDDPTHSGGHDDVPPDADGEDGAFGVSHEAVALDIALPKTGLDPAKPFYIVLHGLNGGSSEPYVLDVVSHALERGCGACVMIARGCMGTPVRGSSLFHGARISDVRCSVRVLRKTLPAETPLAMVGYSMGAIVASNYAAISGKNSGLSCCVSMSGSFDSRTNMTFWHSRHMWQPLLARSLKENFVIAHTRKIVGRGLDLSKVESTGDVLDFDTNMVAPYNGYKSVSDYYVDMSAAAEGKLAGLRTPMLAVSAMDDPIMTAGGLPIDEMEKTKDLYILLTRTGGHVGWPVGWLPNLQMWSWMSTTSLDFCEAVIATASL